MASFSPLRAANSLINLYDISGQRQAAGAAAASQRQKDLLAAQLTNARIGDISHGQGLRESKELRDVSLHEESVRLRPFEQAAIEARTKASNAAARVSQAREANLIGPARRKLEFEATVLEAEAKHAERLYAAQAGDATNKEIISGVEAGGAAETLRLTQAGTAATTANVREGTAGDAQKRDVAERTADADVNRAIAEANAATTGSETDLLTLMDARATSEREEATRQNQAAAYAQLQDPAFYAEFTKQPQAAQLAWLAAKGLGDNKALEGTTEPAPAVVEGNKPSFLQNAILKGQFEVKTPEGISDQTRAGLEMALADWTKSHGGPAGTFRRAPPPYLISLLEASGGVPGTTPQAAAPPVAAAPEQSAPPPYTGGSQMQVDGQVMGGPQAVDAAPQMPIGMVPPEQTPGLDTYEVPGGTITKTPDRVAERKKDALRGMLEQAFQTILDIRTIRQQGADVGIKGWAKAEYGGLARNLGGDVDDDSEKLAGKLQTLSNQVIAFITNESSRYSGPEREMVMKLVGQLSVFKDAKSLDLSLDNLVRVLDMADERVNSQ